MAMITMKLVPEPLLTKRTVLVALRERPIMRGDGDMTFLCGKCLRPLLENVDFEQGVGIVIRCEPCDVCNETPVVFRLQSGS